MRVWLRKARRRAKLTQEEVAGELKITRNYYCLIENGKRRKKLDSNMIRTLAGILPVSVEEIVDWEEREAQG